MLHMSECKDGKAHEQDKTFIVKRVSVSFNDTECQVLNFRDITPFKQLKQEQDVSNLHKSLSASVHHEMIGPLRSNVQLAESLVESLTNDSLKKKAELVLITSKLVLFHADDLLQL